MNTLSIPSRTEERALIRVVRRIVEFAIVRRRAWKDSLVRGDRVAPVHEMSYRSYISAANIAAERLRMRRFR